VASQRLENALNYDFEYVGEYYSESLFGAIKLDRKVIGDMDLVEHYLYEKWYRNKSIRFSELFLHFPLETLQTTISKKKKKKKRTRINP